MIRPLRTLVGKRWRNLMILWGQPYEEFVLTRFDNRFVLLRSVKTVSVVMFCVGDIGIVVNRFASPVLLTANPAGNEVVLSNEPSDA